MKKLWTLSRLHKYSKVMKRLTPLYSGLFFLTSLFITAGCSTSQATGSGSVATADQSQPSSSQHGATGSSQLASSNTSPKTAGAACPTGTMQSGSDSMDGVMNQTVGFVKNGVYVDKAGKPLCPVLGHEVEDIKHAQFTVYKGVKYYFCCDSCPKEFAAHAAAYAAKSSANSASKGKKK